MKKILFVSLGCDKNLVDSEQMIGLLSEKGYAFTDDETQADVIIINTCSFIHDAKEESIETILALAEQKKTGKCRALIVTGCLAQRYYEEMQEEIPEVDAIIGTTAFDEIADVVEETLKGGHRMVKKDIDRLTYLTGHRYVTTGGHFAYLKIAEGCNKRCTYCIIPKIRGNYRSVPMENLLDDARRLASQGVKELILVAQETTVYGVDLYGEKRLPELLRKLCEIPELVWVRILYCYPEEITDELIAVMKEEKKICHYLDLPIQHASDAVLKRMGRRTSRKELKEIILKLRTEIPDICIRTTLITGFPGEAQEDHRAVMEFVDEMEFDRLGVFTYSPEEGTAAEQFEDQIDEDTKEERRSEIMELQQEIAFEKAEAMKGRELEAFVEGSVTGEDVYVARTYKDAPNVDGLIFIHTDAELMTGDMAKVRVTGAYEYDLIGEM